MKLEISMTLSSDDGRTKIDDSAVVQLATMPGIDREQQRSTFLGACDQVIRATADDHLPAMYDRMTEAEAEKEDDDADGDE